MSTTKIYLSASLEQFTNGEEKLQYKIIDLKTFENSPNHPKEWITYFEDENPESKKISKNYKFLSTITKNK